MEGMVCFFFLKRFTGNVEKWEAGKTKVFSFILSLSVYTLTEHPLYVQHKSVPDVTGTKMNVAQSLSSCGSEQREESEYVNKYLKCNDEQNSRNGIGERVINFYR